MSFLILDIETVPRSSIDDQVEEYVMRDVEATHKLFEKLKTYIS